MKATPKLAVLSKEYFPSPKEEPASPKSSVSPEFLPQLKHERSPSPVDEQGSPELSPQPKSKRSKSLSQSP